LFGLLKEYGKGQNDSSVLFVNESKIILNCNHRFLKFYFKNAEIQGSLEGRWLPNSLNSLLCMHSEFVEQKCLSDRFTGLGVLGQHIHVLYNTVQCRYCVKKERLTSFLFKKTHISKQVQ